MAAEPSLASCSATSSSLVRLSTSSSSAARIVRQSANARFVGFLAVTLVGLFVIVYYFLELGMPTLGVESTLDARGEESLIVQRLKQV